MSDFLFSVSFNRVDNLFCTNEASLSSPKFKRAVQSDLTSSRINTNLTLH